MRDHRGGTPDFYRFIIEASEIFWFILGWKEGLKSVVTRPQMWQRLTMLLILANICADKDLDILLLPLLCSCHLVATSRQQKIHFTLVLQKVPSEGS